MSTETLSRDTRRAGHGHLRAAHPTRVCLHPGDADADAFEALAKQLSAGGLFIVTERSFELWTELVIGMRVPAGVVRARVRVVRVVDGEGISCAFVSISPRARALLDDTLGRSGGLAPVSGVIDAYTPAVGQRLLAMMREHPGTLQAAPKVMLTPCPWRLFRR